jgi:hypothetical protein
MSMRLLAASIVLASITAAQGTTVEVERAAKRFTEAAGKTSDALRLEFLLAGAETLKPKYLSLSHQMLEQVLAEIREGKASDPSAGAVRSLANVSFRDAIEVLPMLRPGSAELLMRVAAANHRAGDGVLIFRESLGRGQLALQRSLRFWRSW